MHNIHKDIHKADAYFSASVRMPLEAFERLVETHQAF
jgi:hypothetical protein